ncbi:MAG: sulfurtransferase, partial [Hyphomicrobiales bacterium]|nr:sulfurtransferase [Hyphomicrobiales bacterium]
MADSAFVTTQWVADRLDSPDMFVVDGSWHLPTTGRDGATEHLSSHVPGAVFFDIDAVADQSTGLPHMLPSAELFTATMAGLGLRRGQTVVVYDGIGLFSAPRVRFTFRAFGVEDVRVMAGGFPRWLAEGRPTESGASKRSRGDFTARFDGATLASLADVRAAIASGVAQVADARPANRFTGEAPEPRPGVRRGHMPGA